MLAGRLRDDGAQRMDSSVLRNEWLADLLAGQESLITELWIEEIRAERIPGYESITDEQLRHDLPPTVRSMISAFRHGDTEGPRQHSVGVIKRRLAGGMQLPDLQMSLHALETAVMRIVRDAHTDPARELEALLSASAMYYMVALIAASVYEQLRAEQQKRFVTTYEFGITLSQNLDLGATLETAVRRIAEHVGADAVAILLSGAEGDRDEVRAHYNFDTEVLAVLPDVSASLGCCTQDPASEDLRGAVCGVTDVSRSSRLNPHARLLASRRHLCLVCAPLVAKQRRLGTVLAAWPRAACLSGAEIDFLVAICGHIANAVQNAILYDEAKGRRELDLLLDASKLFASSLDVQDIVNKMAKIGTEVVNADLAVVYAQDIARGQSHTACHARAGQARNVCRNALSAVLCEAEETGFSSLGTGFLDGESVTYRSARDFPATMHRLARTQASAMIIPLKQDDQLHGMFVLAARTPDAFTQDDLLMASGTAELAGLALKNARLYDRQRNIAERLQRSFLPPTLPFIKDYETAAYYRPGMEEAEIGGDLYDVFEAGNSRVGVVIGDVSGKGLNAAIPTAMAKYLVRAYAAESLPPGTVMARLNRAFLESAPEGMFMTALYGVLDPETNDFTYASAGHNPPLFYSSISSRVTEAPVLGLGLGIGSEVDYSEKIIHFGPGDVLLLFTDGATDVKGDGGRLEVEGLARLFQANAHKSADQIAHSLSDGIWDFGHGRLPDDVAIVVLRRRPGRGL